MNPLLSLIERYKLNSGKFKNDIEILNNEIKIFQNESQVIFDHLQHRIAIKKSNCSKVFYLQESDSSKNIKLMSHLLVISVQFVWRILKSVEI